MLSWAEDGTFAVDPNKASALLEFARTKAKAGVRMALKVGAGVLTRSVRTRSGISHKLIPLVLYSADLSEKGVLNIEYRSGAFNILALKEIYSYGDSLFKSELFELEKVLNLGTDQPALEPGSVLQVLKELRPIWDWREEMELDVSEPELALGIYSLPILYAVPETGYTQGLEHELAKLAKVSEEELEGTALAQFLDGVPPDRTELTESHLLEVLPLNFEQRQAIKIGLSQKISLISGPPGTGKSQVISNLLVNSIKSGQTCLFTSKNNKAVDVVDHRVNSLGSHPVMVRLGAGEHRSKLAESLVEILSSSATDEDMDEYELAVKKHEALLDELEDLQRKEERFISIRNELLQHSEEARELMEGVEADVLKKFAKVDPQKLHGSLENLQRALYEADPSNKSLIARVFRFLESKKLNQALIAAYEQIRFAAQDTCVELEPPRYSAAIVSQVHELLPSIQAYFKEVEKIASYLRSSSSFSKHSLEELARERISLQTQVTLSSEQLWKRWVRIKGSLIEQEDRERMSQFGAVMQIVRAAKAEDELDDETRKQYKALSLAAQGVFNCFAVTSLSAHNRVPFEAGTFDCVVFDESSQCDIASALPLLYRAKRAVVIGDPQQLTHVSRISQDADYALMQGKGLSNDYSQWMFSSQSLYDLTASFAPGHSKMELREHHRSHPDIIGFSNNTYYGGRLRLATKLAQLRKSDLSSKSLHWIEVQGQTERGPEGGALNAKEATEVVALLKKLSASNYKGSIGVVTPFRKQVETIESLLKKEPKVYAKLVGTNALHINTAHGFQGDERDLMLFSVVLTPAAPVSAIKYMQSESNVFNVAVTRARAQLIVLGDGSYCGQCEVPHLRKFQSHAQLVMHRPDKSLQTNDDLGTQWPSTLEGSALEKQVYEKLYEQGYRPIPRYDTQAGVVSMAVFLGDKRIALLVDDSPQDLWDMEKLKREQLRTIRLIEQGWDVRRIWSESLSTQKIKL